MRIAILTPGGVDRSGTERVIPCLLWLIERLVRAGDEVHVFAFDQESRPARWNLLGATVHNAGRRPRGLRLLAMLGAEHRRRRFDVLHAFWAVPSGFFGRIASLALRRPQVVTLPGGDVASIAEIGYGGRLGFARRARLRFAVSGAHAITVPSAYMQAQAREAGLRTQRIPLGVALDRWPASPPRRRAPGTPLRLLQVANLNRVKDQATLLGAAAILKAQALDFELEIIGEDVLGGAVQGMAHALGLGENVRFTGFLPHEALRQHFEAADLMVVSSMHEGAPIAMLEAAVAGIPTVGTAVGHLAEYTPDAARAVRVGDSAALAAAIMDLAKDEDKRLVIAAAAQRRATHEDADFTANAFRLLYEAAASRAA